MRRTPLDDGRENLDGALMQPLFSVSFAERQMGATGLGFRELETRDDRLERSDGALIVVGLNESFRAPQMIFQPQ